MLKILRFLALGNVDEPKFKPYTKSASLWVTSRNRAPFSILYFTSEIICPSL